MGKYFEFDKKIGWAQLLSILALVVSAWSLWISYGRAEPQMLVSKDTSIGGKFFDESKGRWRMFGYERLVLSNVGGAPVTLIGLRPPQTEPFSGMVAAIIKNGKAEEVKSEVLLVEEFFEDLKQNPSKLSTYRGWPLEKLGALHRMIPAGGTTTLNVVFLFDAYEGGQPVADYIITNLEMHFSDGSTYSYKVAAEVGPAPKTP